MRHRHPDTGRWISHEEWLRLQEEQEEREAYDDWDDFDDFDEFDEEEYEG
jgi:hypothetical protein